MKKNKDTSNLIFSAFLVTAFVVCSYFISILVQDSAMLTEPAKLMVTAAVYAVFGLVLFYATRVGDGKQVKRFSLSTLLIMVIPAFYIIMAGIAPNLPFSQQIQDHSQVVTFAAMAFGYGIPYTFLSGYELERPHPEEETTEPAEESKEPLTDSEEENHLSDEGEES